MTGKASVVLSHLSPGLTNCATGVANAALDCIPMVVIAGDVPTHYYGKHPHQEVNLHADAQQYEIYRPFVKRAWRVDRADLMAEILEKAFHLAESGQPGPVLVNVPMDIFSETILSTSFDRVRSNTKTLIKPSIDDKVAEEIVNKLNLKHVVITSVDRDDLDDGGAEHFSQIILETRKMNNKTTIEVLTPDFFRKGDSVRGVIENVELRGNKPRIIFSRTSPLFLEKLFEQEIPEVFDGLINIKKVVRIPGEKAKVAVDSYDDRIDPVGACVGMRGSRVQAVVNELQGEKIDIVNWSEDPALVVSNALSPAEVQRVNVDNDLSLIHI